MGRLKGLKSSLQRMPPRVAYLERQEDVVRDLLRPGRQWYGTARWQRLRWQVLVDARFTCARCARIEGNTAFLVADHVVPHRDDPQLFWDRGNLQCLCKRCHDSEKQREERDGRMGGGGSKG